MSVCIGLKRFQVIQDFCILQDLAGAFSTVVSQNSWVIRTTVSFFEHGYHMIVIIDNLEGYQFPTTPSHFITWFTPFVKVETVIVSAGKHERFVGVCCIFIIGTHLFSQSNLWSISFSGKQDRWGLSHVYITLIALAETIAKYSVTRSEVLNRPIKVSSALNYRLCLDRPNTLLNRLEIWSFANVGWYHNYFEACLHGPGTWSTGTD